MKNLVIILLLLFPLLASAMPAQILIIRHGEKTPTGPELSEKGWQRAKALPQLFHKRTEFSKYGLPVALYAMSAPKPGKSLRAIQTLKYVADDLKIKINSDFARDDYAAMIEHIKNDKSLNKKFVVICWEHQVMSPLAAKLGVEKVPTIRGSQYDRAWLLTYADDGKLTKFEDLPQKLLPDDAKE